MLGPTASPHAAEPVEERYAALKSEVSTLREATAGLRTELDDIKTKVEKSKPNILQKYAPVGSALTAVLALGVSCYYYLHALDATRASLADNLVYTMQKDERSLVADFTSSKPGVSAANIIAQIQSIYIQNTLGSIP